MTHIAITASVAQDASGGVHPDVAPYTRAVERVGARWSIAPNDPACIDALLADVDGVIVSGGVDVDPARYAGRTLHARSQAGNYRADRDAFEIALVCATRERGIPTLAICRGLQIVNVAFGGTLIEDVREELGNDYTIEHRQTYESGLDRSDYAPGHDLAFEADSDLARLAGASRFRANSMHHQAIRRLGDGLRVVARSSDGVIEAVEATFDHPLFVAVQWHPEELDDEVARHLFAALNNACVKQR